MKVILFGASGRVGQGALRELLKDTDVDAVLSIGRNATGQHHSKLKELLQEDVGDLRMLEHELAGYGACLFCLGVSAAGMSELDYKRITYDLTLKVARTLERLNPKMTFVYLSSGGTDSTERGGVMWARVKGATESALLSMPFERAYMLRPGFVRPLQGTFSKTPRAARRDVGGKPTARCMRWSARSTRPSSGFFPAKLPPPKSWAAPCCSC